tara:strand:- start:683 stop:1315 length:633 start_codon:yes stop_codon:yes gene_type:complete
MAEEPPKPTARDRLWPFALGMAAVALVVYVFTYAGDQSLRSKDGGWQVTFTTNSAGTPMLRVDLPSKGFTNCTVVFEGESVPADFQPLTTNFTDPTHLPVPVLFGEWFYADLTYLPGAVTFNLFGKEANGTAGMRHEVELIQAGLVVDRHRHDWQPDLAVIATAENKRDWPKPEKQKGNLRPWHMFMVLVIIGGVMLLVRRFSNSNQSAR